MGEPQIIPFPGTTFPPHGVCYIAGPAREQKGYDRAAFDRLAKRLRMVGYEAVGRWELEELGHPASSLMRQVVATLSRCSAITLLPGWWRNPEARFELRAASKMDIPVIDPETFAPRRTLGVWRRA